MPVAPAARRVEQTRGTETINLNAPAPFFTGVKVPLLVAEPRPAFVQLPGTDHDLARRRCRHAAHASGVAGHRGRHKAREASARRLGARHVCVGEGGVAGESVFDGGTGCRFAQKTKQTHTAVFKYIWVFQIQKTKKSGLFALIPKLCWGSRFCTFSTSDVCMYSELL